MTQLSEDTLRARYPRSSALYQRACAVIPGGVSSPVRAFRAVGGTPLFIARGAGAQVFDADGRSYLDLVGSWGPLIAGHAHPAVVAAVGEALQRGATFGAPSSAGVPEAFTACTRVLPLDDEAAARALFERDGARIAAVIIEPVP